MSRVEIIDGNEKKKKKKKRLVQNCFYHVYVITSPRRIESGKCVLVKLESTAEY